MEGILVEDINAVFTFNVKGELSILVIPLPQGYLCLPIIISTINNYMWLKSVA